MGFLLRSLVSETAPPGLLYPDFPYDHTRSIASGSLYVDPVSGSSGNNGLSQGAAKQTIAQAIAALGTSSSKKIYLMNGTHTLSSTVTTSGSGTAGSPIEVTSLPGHEPVVDINGLARGFDLDGTSYWRFSHLTIDNWGGTGCLGAFVVAEDIETIGFELFAIEGSTANGGDNQGLVHYWSQARAPDTVIDRVKLHFTGDNTQTANQFQNTAGFYVNRSTSTTSAITFDHLEIDGFPIGIYHKHGEEGRTTLSNATCSNSIFTNHHRVNIGHNPAGWLYTNCVFGDSPQPIILAEEDGGPAGDANQFVHCTFFTGLRLRAQGDGANNNKLLNCVMNDDLEIETGSITADSNYNAFAPGSIIDGMAIAAWRAANSSDANSVQGTISFVGGADDSLPEYYALAGGSTGKNAASDGTDMGADVTAIGVQAA